MSNLEKYFETQLASWYRFYRPLLIETDYGSRLVKFLIQKKNVINPGSEFLFAPFKATHFNECKVIMLSNSPYPEKGKSNGLGQGIHSGQKIPTSLKRIKEELDHEYGYKKEFDTTLMSWATQGVLMLNESMTTMHNQTSSHLKVWQPFIEYTYTKISQNQYIQVVFVQFGASAWKYSHYARNKFVINAPHPVDDGYQRSGGFIGCDVFKRINSFVQYQIAWNQ
jgi:uracil-DNA glycosylase